jgi:hypothetical protein
METLSSSVASEVAMAEPAKGSFLPRIVVERQLELARLGEQELMLRFTAYWVALTLRYGPGMTPRKLLLLLAEQSKISDAAWYEKTSPELRRLIREAGIDLETLEGL